MAGGQVESWVRFAQIIRLCFSCRRLWCRAGAGGARPGWAARSPARSGRFADGAWLIELAPVRDPVQVARVAAVALGVREQPGVPAAEGLVRVLARRQLLVVLDNCEH